MDTELHFRAVLERLRGVLGVREDKEVAAALGMKPNTLHNRKATGSIPLSEVVALASKKKLSLDWLLLGVGGMYRGRGDQNPPLVEIDQDLFSEVNVQLDREFHRSRNEPHHLSEAEWSTMRGHLAVLIYNRAILISGAAERSKDIQTEAAILARAAAVASHVTSQRRRAKP